MNLASHSRVGGSPIPLIDWGAITELFLVLARIQSARSYTVKPSVSLP